MRTAELSKNNVRSKVEVPIEVDKIGSSDIDFVLSDTFCAVAADITCTETIWLIKITK